MPAMRQNITALLIGIALCIRNRYDCQSFKGLAVMLSTNLVNYPNNVFMNFLAKFFKMPRYIYSFFKDLA